MYSTHLVLVNLANAIESNASDEHLRKEALGIAEEETNCFYERVFDHRSLLEEGENEDFPVSVVLSKNDWPLFEDYLLRADKMQKNYARALMSRVIANNESSCLNMLLEDSFLSHDRTANADEIVKNGWEYDEIADTPWKLNIIAELMSGKYNIDSHFYDTYRETALVPFLANLKETPDNWALVAFSCHF